MTALALVSSRAPEHEEAAAHGFLGVPSIIWQTLNLGLFLVVLYWLLRKPAVKFFSDRKSAVAEANRKAEADRRRAEELAKEIAARLSGIEVEIAGLKTHAVKESEAEQKELLLQAEADAGRIVARGAAEIDARVREARLELTAFAADLAVEMANDILKKSVTPEDHSRLVNEGTDALTTLAGLPGGKKA